MNKLEGFPTLFPPVQSTRNVSKIEKKRGKRREKGGKGGKRGEKEGKREETEKFVEILRIYQGKEYLL